MTRARQMFQSAAAVFSLLTLVAISVSVAPNLSWAQSSDSCDDPKFLSCPLSTEVCLLLSPVPGGPQCRNANETEKACLKEACSRYAGQKKVICGLDFESWPDKYDCVSKAELGFRERANLEGTIEILIGLLFPVALEACVGPRLASLVKSIQDLLSVASAATEAEALFEAWKSQLNTCGSTGADGFRAFLDSLDIPNRAKVFCMAEFEMERQRKYQSLDEYTSKKGKECCKVKTILPPREIPIQGAL